MGRNLWIEDVTFSRAFTILVWDDFFGLFGGPPESLTPEALYRWTQKVRRLSSETPVIFEIWWRRADGHEENSVAYARWGEEKIRLEGCYDELIVSPVEEFPELQYQPPEWKGVDRFNEVFRGTGLRLQAEPLAVFFGAELDRMAAVKGENARFESGIL